MHNHPLFEHLHDESVSVLRALEEKGLLDPVDMDFAIVCAEVIRRNSSDCEIYREVSSGNRTYSYPTAQYTQFDRIMIHHIIEAVHWESFQKLKMAATSSEWRQRARQIMRWLEDYGYNP